MALTRSPCPVVRAQLGDELRDDGEGDQKGPRGGIEDGEHFQGGGAFERPTSLVDTVLREGVSDWELICLLPRHR